MRQQEADSVAEADARFLEHESVECSRGEQLLARDASAPDIVTSGAMFGERRDGDGSVWGERWTGEWMGVMQRALLCRDGACVELTWP